MISRREIVLVATGTAAAACLVRLEIGAAAKPVSAPSFEIVKSDEEWRHQLSHEEYAVLRLHETERPWSSPLNKEHRPGTYLCVGCSLPLFSSTTKYESESGWPSFWAPIEGAIETSEDRSLFFLVRTEVHCHRCGGHLGHVFNDGPQPSGLRYCMNGVALRFRPENA